MNIESKPWNWGLNSDSTWLEPSSDSYYLSHRWKQLGYQDLLDFGCGLGRHSVYFVNQGFRVKAFDLSIEGVKYLQQWSKRENQEIDVQVADMISLPYEDNSFDCIFAYNVVSHTSSQGISKIISEIDRVLKRSGELFLTFCSKETWSFNQDQFPKIDENTILKVGGVEDGIPHFHVDRDEIFSLLSNFQIEQIRHIDECFADGQLQNSKHYFVIAKK